MKYAKHILILAALSAATACTGDFEDFNRNPNKQPVGTVTPDALMEPLIYSATNSYSSYMLSIANEISQVTVAKSSPRQEHRYNLDNGNFESIWNLGFKWAANAKHMYELAVAQEQPNYQAMGLTMKVYHMSILTDMFGSIAYSEALLGNEGILRPRIEPQKEVYERMFGELEQANSLFDSSASFPNATKDGLFGGNVLQWRKFVNSLHLRLLMRVGGRNEAFTPSVGERIAKIINNPETYPIFESNADNASVKYSAGSEYYKGYFNTTEFYDDKSLSGDHHVSSQFLGMITNNTTGFVDPRMYIWIKPRYTPTEIRPMEGAPSGGSVAFNDYAKRNDKEPYLHYETLVRDRNTADLMCYDEVLFIKAEAALNGWIGTGSAQKYYEEAIAASCEKWNAVGQFASYPTIVGTKVAFSPVAISSNNVAALLASEEAKWDGTRQRLGEQKWLSLFWVVGFQMYHEMRRTGYPECKTGRGTVELNRTQGKFIARYPYPLIAIANNRANYEAAFAAQGGSVANNNMIFPVWWSGQAVAKDAGQPWEHSFRKNVVAEEIYN